MTGRTKRKRIPEDGTSGQPDESLSRIVCVSMDTPRLSIPSRFSAVIFGDKYYRVEQCDRPRRLLRRRSVIFDIVPRKRASGHIGIANVPARCNLMRPRDGRLYMLTRDRKETLGLISDHTDTFSLDFTSGFHNLNDALR